MEYYAEYVFAENFLIDFILLYITGNLLKKKIYIRRLTASAIIGAIYVLAILYFKKEFIGCFLVNVSISLLMIVVAYNPSGLIDYIRVLLCFYIVTLIMVGIVSVLYYLGGSHFTVDVIVVSMFGGFFVLKLLFAEIKRRRENNYYIRTITVKINSKEKSIRAFIDTGNELKDPLNGKPVVVINIDSIGDILGEEIKKEIIEFYECKGKNYVNLFLDRYEELHLRVLRYNTISSKGDLMMCIVPDEMTMKTKNKGILDIDAVIGIYPYKLSEENEYEALLFKKFMDLESGNEYELC